MSPAMIFQTQLVLGYVPWLLILAAYGWPWLRSMDHIEAHRVIATLHSFRFFGLAFIIPGVVGANLPAGFASYAFGGATGNEASASNWQVTVRAHRDFLP